jgi:D-hexose-6-phosphate mutarotase
MLIKYDGHTGQGAGAGYEMDLEFRAAFHTYSAHVHSISSLIVQGLGSIVVWRDLHSCIKSEQSEQCASLGTNVIAAHPGINATLLLIEGVDHIP